MKRYSWSWLTGPELDSATLYGLLSLRVAVFVVEQQCPYQELDGRDLPPTTEHLLVRQDDEIVATLRLLVPEEPHAPVAIGRVVIHPDHRGSGLGHRLMEAALTRIGERWDQRDGYLSAQAHLQGLYARHGFEPVTDAYLEDGIPHIGMRRTFRIEPEK